MTVVLDTCVLVAGLRSRRGASYELLSRLGQGGFETAVSVSLVLEYEEVLKRQARTLGLTQEDIQDVLDYVCSVSLHQKIFYLWRPQLPDADDDAILELAANARCDAIVTHNARHFAGSERFGVSVMTPAELLRWLRGRP